MTIEQWSERTNELIHIFIAKLRRARDRLDRVIFGISSQHQVKLFNFSFVSDPPE